MVDGKGTKGRQGKVEESLRIEREGEKERREKERKEKERKEKEKARKKKKQEKRRKRKGKEKDKKKEKKIKCHSKTHFINLQVFDTNTYSWILIFLRENKSLKKRQRRQKRALKQLHMHESVSYLIPLHHQHTFSNSNDQILLSIVRIKN